jgi:AcrR family transcriptional regulator
MREAPPDRRERQRQHTRRELRRCALSRFARLGFEKASVADIAADAGVSERTFYRHFPTKEAVLFEDFASRLGWFRDALELRPEDEPILESVRVAVESFPDDREVVRQVARLRASLLGSAAVEDQMRRIQGDFAREIERHAARRLPRGPGRPLAAAVLGASIGGALLAALRVWGEGGGDDTDELRDATARALALLRDLPAAAAGRDPRAARRRRAAPAR